MTDTDPGTKVVPLKLAAPSREGWGPREQDALIIARLAAMPVLEYERARATAAKQLKCRVSWLDKTIENIRITRLQYWDHYPPAKDGRTSAGHPINFVRDDGSEIMSFLIRSAHRNGKDRHLVVLADGNATTVDSVSLNDEQIAQLKARQEADKYPNG